MVSDHLPLSVHLECEVNVINNANHDTKANPKTNVKWTGLTESDKNIYSVNSDNLLQNVYIPADAIICTSCRCQSQTHRVAIDRLYTDIVHCLHEASEIFESSRTKKKYQIVAGWN